MTENSTELTGKTGIVTGAGGIGGIGAATARRLAQSGARLVLADLPGAQLQDIATTLRQEGFEVSTCPTDISDEAAVAALMDFTKKTYGGLDFLVNNAASQGHAGDMDVVTMSVEFWDRIMSVNARGTMLMCKHAVPLLIAAGGGSIVNISSGTAAQGDFYATAYAATKGAINTLTKYVATQYGAQGVRCNAIAPGLVMTPRLGANMPAPMQEIFRQHCLTQSLGLPEDIPESVEFLVSARSRFITAQVIAVDGGIASHVPTTVQVAKLFAAPQAQSPQPAPTKNWSSNMSTTDQFNGNVVLITGTGGGQGRVAALEFAARGAIVVGCDVNGAANDETTALVRAAGGKMSATGAMDLGDPEQARAWVEAAAAEHGRINIVYNNASSARFAPVGEMSVEDWRYTMRNEIDLVFYVTRFAWRFLAKQGGVIINIASVAGHAGSKSAPIAAHATAKGAIIALTKQLAVEGAPVNIRAVSISPGVIETPGTREMLNSPEVRTSLMADTLIPRPGRPEEVVALALYLASDAAAYITGSDFVIDGGRMAV